MSTEERREVKKKLRREVLARRAALTEPERERGNLLITERILGRFWALSATEVKSARQRFWRMPCRMANVSMFRRWKVRKCVFTGFNPWRN